MPQKMTFSSLKTQGFKKNNLNYYPFGMQMPGRVSNSNSYRYGYNGMEIDDEIKGEGNSYTTEFRQYDPRLGRWLSLDPLMASFPWMSPYCAFDNNPVYYIDPYGLCSGTGDNGIEDPLGNEGCESNDGAVVAQNSQTKDPELPSAGKFYYFKGNTSKKTWNKNAKTAMDSNSTLKKKQDKVMNQANIRKNYLETTYDYNAEDPKKDDIYSSNTNDEGGQGYLIVMYHKTSKKNLVPIEIPIYEYTPAYDDGYGDKFSYHKATLNKIELADFKNTFTNCFADALGLYGNLGRPNTILKDDYTKISGNNRKTGSVGVYSQATNTNMTSKKGDEEVIHAVRIIGFENGKYIYRSNWLGSEAVEGTWDVIKEQMSVHGFADVKETDLIWYNKK